MLNLLQKRLNATQVLSAAMYVAVALFVLLIAIAAVLPANVSGYVIRELVICIGASSLVGLITSPMAIIETWRRLHTKEEHYDESQDALEQAPDRIHHLGNR